jgi:uncharacterized protein YoxC
MNDENTFAAKIKSDLRADMDGLEERLTAKYDRLHVDVLAVAGKVDDLFRHMQAMSGVLSDVARQLDKLNGK